MQKRLVPHPVEEPVRSAEWFDLADVAVEITSEDETRSIERALLDDDPHGWRAGKTGVQTIRLIFEHPRAVRRIQLSFVETEAARTQEFVLRWAPEGGTLREIVRQQWNFSPDGAIAETEDYEVQLPGVKLIELMVNPNVGGGHFASLRRLRVA